VGPVKKKSPNFQNHKIGGKKKKLVIIGLKECRTPHCRPLSGAGEKKITKLSEPQNWEIKKINKWKTPWS
jgi:hypothetical protein